MEPRGGLPAQEGSQAALPPVRAVSWPERTLSMQIFYSVLFLVFFPRITATIKTDKLEMLRIKITEDKHCLTKEG